jgi:dipeptidyl aminopeptidase/acylaminoacyl peptidase
MFSDATDELIATVYIDEQVRILWKDKTFEADHNLLKQKMPGKEIVFQSSTTDERLQVVVARADVDPGTVYLFDRQSKQLTQQYVSREKLPRASLSPMTAIRYKSSDGLEIPAYLTLPKGVEPRNLPLLVVPHGGPWARDVWGYNSLAQFWSNRGYAVLQPNFRGSTGYGKKFLDAGNKQWGDKMQDDITWGVKHLIAQGTVDPKRVGIFGGSYGGYATLAGVAFTPDYAAQFHSAVLGSWQENVFRAARGSCDPGRQGAARTSVAAELGGEDQDASHGGSGRERSAGEEGGVGTDRHGPARSRRSGGIPPRRR